METNTTDWDTQYIHGTTFSQTDATIPDSWILLDSQSTVCIFKNPIFLTNIRPEKRHLRVITNGGYQTTTQERDLANFLTVWYNPQSLADIMSLEEVQKQCRVTMDTATEKAIVIHRANGTKMKFVESNSGLFYFETNNNGKTKQSVTDYTLVQTVEENKSHYSRCNIEGADKSREIQEILGHPS